MAALLATAAFALGCRCWGLCGLLRLCLLMLLAAPAKLSFASLIAAASNSETVIAFCSPGGITEAAAVGCTERTGAAGMSKHSSP